MYRVFCTNEGLIGKLTATGLTIQEDSLFVALPSVKALHKWVRVVYGNMQAIVPVEDIGPWSPADSKGLMGDEYWNDSNPVPLSTYGIRLPRSAQPKPTNPSGIDLSTAVFKGLGLADNNFVQWEFVDKPEDGKAVISTIT